MNRKLVLAAIACIGLPVLGCGGLVGFILATSPPNQGPRVDATDFVGVDTGGSYAWVVPTRTGVVLVDAGLQPDAANLKAEVGDRTVHAVLVTHGHLDHIYGLSAFPAAEVYAGPGEAPLLRGEAAADTLGAQVFDWIMRPELDALPGLREVRQGEVLTIDGHTFTAIHTPGHTAGSMAYHWKDVVFTGDTLLGHGTFVAPGPWLLAEDPAQNRASVAELLPLSFDRMADGHAGVHAGARAQVEAFVD